MKSKTSESFVASESNGVKRELGVDEVKQKQLKKGKGSDGNGWAAEDRQIVSSKSSAPVATNCRLFYFMSVRTRF